MPLRWDESFIAPCRRPQHAEPAPTKPPRWQGGKLSDPLGYYKKHYDGLTRGQLQRAHAYVYHRLRQSKQLHHVPTVRKVGPRPLVRKIDDLLEYYAEHYDGLTRGELSRIDAALYTRLRRVGLLDCIPGKRTMGPRRRLPDPGWMSCSPA